MKSENLGEKLSKTELKTIVGGYIIHGECLNGNHFSFLVSSSTSFKEQLDQINITFCGGGGLHSEITIISNGEVIN